MKKKLLWTLFVFIFIGGSFLISPRRAQACAAAALCPSGDASVCANPTCADCSWCIYEDISGKVVNPALPADLSRRPGTAFLQNLLQGAIRLFLVVGVVIFFFMFLIGGINWITGGGDKVKTESAQKQITHSLIGLAILFSAFAIIKLVGYLFGIDLLKITLPTL